MLTLRLISCYRLYEKQCVSSTELSPVQQQLSEINNRYSLLGSKLADRQAELDAIREELKKHLDSLRGLNTFLDKVSLGDLVPKPIGCPI